jgi:hypothetical protein
MKKYLISFGSKGYENTLTNLRNSASPFFDEIILYNENNITELKDLYPKHFEGGRGFGYWLWKPYLILKTLNNIKDDDIIMYTDATINFVNNPLSLFNLLANKDIILFSNEYKNSQFTKYDTFHELDALDEKFTNGKHVNAAVILIKKTVNSLIFVEEYLNFCKNFKIISDEPNTNGINFSDFIDHRHDQSILSILSIKNQIELYKDPTQWGDKHNELFTNSHYGVILNHHRKKY